MSRISRTPTLIEQARVFKDELSELLNQVGYEITATNYRSEQKIPLTLGGHP